MILKMDIDFIKTNKSISTSQKTPGTVIWPHPIFSNLGRASRLYGLYKHKDGDIRGNLVDTAICT